METMTHDELVVRAARWLKNTFHCRVVLSELVAYTMSGETPDVIGWAHNKSILVECKSSVVDYHADKRKPARRPDGIALGHWRFYLTPPGLIPESIPYGWGLYEVHGRRILHRGGWRYANAVSPPFESDQDSEKAMLISALSRKQLMEKRMRPKDEISICDKCGKKVEFATMIIDNPVKDHPILVCRGCFEKGQK